MTGRESDSKKNHLTKSHTVYKVAGKRVPSVTTILGVTNYGNKMGALMGWQRRELLAGNDPQAMKGQAALIGTLAHALIEQYLTKNAKHLKIKKIDLSYFSEDQIKTAKVAYRAFLKWRRRTKPETLTVEEHLTHPDLLYGGTIDYLCRIDKRLTLIDFKSSNAVYLDHRLQVAGYQELVRVHYDEVPDTWILHLGKDQPKFGDYHFPDLSLEWEAFQNAIQAYDINRRLGK